jgi:hypothetical protein
MNALGLRPEDFPEDDGVPVWPCCWSSVQVFARMETQWNVGAGVAVGLRYEAFPIVLRACGVPQRDRAQVFADLQTMERVALRVMREK